MKKLPDAPSYRQVLNEASEWFVDFRVGDVDAEARARFDEWLRRSPEHIRAYMEIARTYVELPSMDPGKPDVAALIAYARSEGNVLPLNPGPRAQGPHVRAQALEQSSSVSRQNDHARPRRRRFLAAATAAIVLVIAGAVFWQSMRFPLYTTDIGERRSLTLADGSTVDLNARSSIRIEFSSSERRVELLAGQALFQVAKDKHRPFIVRSGDATVRAVGTQFDVYRKDSGTTVTVLEGRVAVYSVPHAGVESATDSAASTSLDAASSRVDPQPRPQTRYSGNSSAGSAAPSLPQGPPDSPGAGAVFVSAGEQVTVTPDSIVPIAHADLTSATAWTQRKLIFDGSKLSDVASEFNRYNRRQIVIEGPLSDFHVSGIYSSTDPTSFIRFLSEQPGIKVTEGDSEIRIESK